MATCRYIIKRGLQKLAIIAPGNDPEASEAETGLAVLQGLFDTWANAGMFGRLDAAGITEIEAQDIVTTALPEIGAPVSLPILVKNSDGEDVLPPDLAYAEYVNTSTSERRAYLFDRRTAKWARIDALTLDTDCPLAVRNSEGMASALAVYMAGDFGVEPGPLVLRQAGSFQVALSTRMGEPRVETTAVYF
jgi:hypothetical protein